MTFDLNKEETRLVMKMIALDWAILAIRQIGSQRDVVNSAYSIYRTSARRKIIATHNVRRAALARIISKTTAQELPEPNKSAFLKPWSAPGKPNEGKQRFLGHSARTEAERLTGIILEQVEARL